jgi:hypothetical protein
MKRIRYTKNADGTLTSNKTFEVNGKAVVLTLNPTSKSFSVIDTVSKNTLSNGEVNANVSFLKIAAKKALSDLGVVFDEETRSTSED